MEAPCPTSLSITASGSSSSCPRARAPRSNDAVPRVVFTDPQAAAVGATNKRFSGTARLSQLPKAETYTLTYTESKGFLILLYDGQRLTGAYALGP
jgi:pyruvate/2-oxoglutarate dehydrogenase complex dihydrolipoamide dehydrogenase (E3) component